MFKRPRCTVQRVVQPCHWVSYVPHLRVHNCRYGRRSRRVSCQRQRKATVPMMRMLARVKFRNSRRYWSRRDTLFDRAHPLKFRKGHICLPAVLGDHSMENPRLIFPAETPNLEIFAVGAAQKHFFHRTALSEVVLCVRRIDIVVEYHALVCDTRPLIH